ncbi:MAG: sulfatase, partial [Planctomycetota bacterium]
MRAPQLPAATRGALLLGVAVLLGIAPFGTVACSPDPERVPPLVVLVSLDTVRADELSCYGGPEGASPVLDAFAAVATRYERCISTAPWTLPSHASMFTGLFPSEHGAHSFLPQDGYRGDNVFALHPSYETLAEALGARGYRCGAFVANSIYLRPGLGLEAGFDPWDVRRNRAEVLTGRALEWLDGVGAGERPAFLFLNYLDAHRPYRTGDPEDRARARLDELIEAVMVEGGEPGALGRDVAALHQKAVTLLDAELARLFDGLKERGLFDRAVVVVTADHGEAFGAHGVVEHSKDVYEDLVRVPLVVKESRQTEGAVRTELASAVDVPGLVAAALAGTDAASAAAVFPRLPGTHPVIAENHFSRIKDVSRFGDRFRRVRRALYDGDAKVVVGSDGSLELYELEGDPGELTDLAGSQPARA